MWIVTHTLKHMCKLSIDSRFSEVRQASELLKHYCGLHHISMDHQGQLELMLIEALNNVIEHAYLGAPGNPIDIELEASPHQIVMRITDRGVAAPGSILIEGSELPNINELPEGGWGLCLIQALADTIEYYRHKSHNTLVLIKNRS